MAAGQGFKTFTTGEVLTAGDVNGYLMQGINVFASEAARDAAITAPAEGQFAFTKDNNSLWYYTGSAWAASGATGDIEGVTAGVGISGGGTSGTVTITNSMATAIDAKGDLVAGTAADTFSRLAVGTDGQILTADSTAATGLAWAAASSGTPYVAGKNNVINGGFDFWQRGTSTALTSSYVYLADRFKTNGRDGVGTQSRHTLTAAESVICANLTYAHKLDVTTAAATNKPRVITALEDAQLYYGRAVTVSFYAKASKSLTLETQGNLVWANADNTSSVVSNSLTTTFQRFTYTFTLSPSGTYNPTTDYLQLYFTAPQSDTYTIYITGVQAEFASSATAFNRNSANPQAELAACQRYYTRFGGTNYMAIGTGVYVSATSCRIFIPMPVFLRTAPTLSNSTASDFGIFNGSGNDQASAISANSLDVNSAALDITVTSRTAGYAGILNTRTNPSAYIAFSAEL